jgi:hypothetical protein
VRRVIHLRALHCRVLIRYAIGRSKKRTWARGLGGRCNRLPSPEEAQTLRAAPRWFHQTKRCFLLIIAILLQNQVITIVLAQTEEKEGKVQASPSGILDASRD